MTKPRHGSPFDRGSADAYYGREADPHYFVGDTYRSDKVEMEKMSPSEIEEYFKGYNTQTDRKDWGDGF